MNPKHCTRRDFLSLVSGTAAAAAISPVAPLFAAPSALKTGYAYTELFTNFYQSPEVPDRVIWINERLRASGLAAACTPIAPYATPMEYIQKEHTAAHIALIGQIQAAQYYVPVAPIAELAVGHVIGAVRDVCEGKIKNAFCNIRPPGHHALDEGWAGYCCYANMAIAARYAREIHKVQKILIVDWDAHHGNGTQGHLCGDADTLFFDLYEWSMSPNPCNDYTSRAPADVSTTLGDMRVNIIMPSGSRNGEYQRLFEEKLVPLAQQFKPELVMISCGFDAKAHDTHSSTLLTARGYSQLTRRLMDIADEWCGGKIVSILEGGYADNNTNYGSAAYTPTFIGLAAAAQAHAATLSTGELQPEDPYFSDVRISSPPAPALTHGDPYIIGSMLCAPGRNIGRITITNVHGRVLLTVDKPGARVDLQNLRLPAGHLLVTMHQMDGRTIVLPYSPHFPAR